MAIRDILNMLRENGEDVARITVSRDLEGLVRDGYLKRSGAGRGVRYEVTPRYGLMREIDTEGYFSIEPDHRDIREGFNFQIFSYLTDIFTSAEKAELRRLNELYTTKRSALNPDALKQEIERLNIDFSWKSSKIEGNTYSLLETERLIKEREETEGHAREEAVMILNHKQALEYIGEHSGEFRDISLQKIEHIHSLLMRDLLDAKGLRSSLVRITGTKYRPIDNRYQIREALERTCVLVNETESVFEKAVLFMLLIAYIQPFVDGNKRTSRLCGNAILQAYGACPLSYRSMDEVEYKKAVLLFYEQNNINYFKKIFIEQFRFVVGNYFG